MSYTASNGMLDIQTTPLARIGYHNTIIARVFEQDFIPEITNTTIKESDFQCNSVVQFVKQPIVGEWRQHEKGQNLIADQISPEAFSVKICNAKYKAIILTNEDIREACDRWDAWEASFKESTYESIAREWRQWVLAAMISETHPGNKGSKAGANKNFDLGSIGKPIIVTARNVMQHIVNLRTVLKSRLRWEDGKMFIVIPDELYAVIATSEYANVGFTGDCQQCSMGITGFMPKQLFGFNVVQTGCAPQAKDPSGELAFYIVAGHIEAYAFIADITEGRVMQMPNAFNIQYQMKAIWGGKAIHPEALALGYWAIDFN